MYEAAWRAPSPTHQLKALAHPGSLFPQAMAITGPGPTQSRNCRGVAWLHSVRIFELTEISSSVWRLQARARCWAHRIRTKIDTSYVARRNIRPSQGTGKWRSYWPAESGPLEEHDWLYLCARAAGREQPVATPPADALTSFVIHGAEVCPGRADPRDLA